MGVDKIKISVRYDQLFKTSVENEKKCAIRWKEKYNWMPAEYIALQQELNEFSKLIPKRSFINPDDKRTIKPCPETVNGEYGWLSTRKEFQLQKFGPDVMAPDPIPSDDFFED